MTPARKRRDTVASVHQRLLNLARERDADFKLMLKRYLGERFLYRLGLSPEVDRFTLKGAALFLVWTGREFRPTRDVDLLGPGSEDPVMIRRAMEAICAVEYPSDGISFDAASIRVGAIRGEQEQGGTRVKLVARLGQASLTLQVDVGFGDVISPERREAEFPTLLEQPPPNVWAYPRETFVAEKFEAIVRLGRDNTRMKDFWDVAAIANQFPFDGETLRIATGETFRTRQTPFGSELPDALRPAFYEDPTRVGLWQAFQTKAGSEIDVPVSFDAVGERIRGFLGPVRESLTGDGTFARVWPPRGPWKPSSFRIEGGEEDV